MQAETDRMLQEGTGVKAQVGDTIVVESERIAQHGRRGVIEEILEREPLRFRVRWDEGRTSIFVPSAGVVRIVERERTATRRK